MAWPTQRQGHYYVGSGPTKGKVIKRLRSKVQHITTFLPLHTVMTISCHAQVCPVQCRPEEHKDWKYC